MSLDLETRIRNVTAVLGPTNTGKTHLAIERMLGHETGLIGLPLRLLAREVYDKIASRVGAANVALVTGEEKIKPESPRYYVCTVEAMPRDVPVDFLAIDEIQLAADPERGHVFTDRLLHARGKLETLMLGAGTMRDAIGDLIPGANFISRPRLSKLTYAGEKKITRLPPRSAIVAFSANEVYSVAELIRRQRGGAAVVLGALSPRTRNAQVALYQSGDVDFLVATDAIGMGLNLAVEHVAFAAMRKFDGQVHRDLTPGELGQIAGRAGRHMNDGTFGVTAGVEAPSSDLIERLENHTFDSARMLQWRSRELDLGSLDRLRDSLRQAPREGRLVRARMSDDVAALEAVANDPEVVALASSRIAVARLWDVCQVPDYRKISSQNHAELVATLYKFTHVADEHIPEDWFAKQVAFADRTDGDIDTLANRIAHIRTWTFVANRADWLKDPEHWQARTRQIEDQLSDALHERLTQRFVDRRTSALMKGLRDKDELYADIGEDGAVHVEKHYVGRLKGFRFSPDTSTAEGVHAKATRNAAAHVLAKELVMRARRVASAKVDAFKLARDGSILWREEEIGRLEKGDDPLKPQVVVLADEHLTGPDKERVQERLNAWIAEVIGERLKPLVDISRADDISGLGRGIAFRLKESFGVLRRDAVADTIKSLDQPARAQLRKHGVRFGAFNIYFPQLLKPATVELALVLWTIQEAQAAGLSRDELPQPPRAGLTSLPVDSKVPDTYYRTAGFHVCGARAVRIDMLERLADQIRPLLAWRAPADNPSATPPKGGTGDGGFTITPDMMSILGCSAEELGNVLKVLGFRSERRQLPSEPPATALVTVASGAAVASEAVLDTVRVQTADAPAPAITVDRQDAATGDAVAAADAARQPTEAALPSEPSLGTPVASEPASGPTLVAGLEPSAVPEPPKSIEVWRPKRRGSDEHRHRRTQPGDEGRDRRADRRGRGRQHQPAPAGGDEQPARHADRPPGDQSDPRGGGPRGHPAPKPRRDNGRRQRDERPRPGVHSAAPPRKPKVEADSPFAALSSLKAALEKRSQD